MWTVGWPSNCVSTQPADSGCGLPCSIFSNDRLNIHGLYCECIVFLICVPGITLMYSFFHLLSILVLRSMWPSHDWKLPSTRVGCFSCTGDWTGWRAGGCSTTIRSWLAMTELTWGISACTYARSPSYNITPALKDILVIQTLKILPEVIHQARDPISSWPTLKSMPRIFLRLAV